VAKRLNCPSYYGYISNFVIFGSCLEVRGGNITNQVAYGRGTGTEEQWTALALHTFPVLGRVPLLVLLVLSGRYTCDEFLQELYI